MSKGKENVFLKRFNLYRRDPSYNKWRELVYMEVEESGLKPFSRFLSSLLKRAMAVLSMERTLKSKFPGIECQNYDSGDFLLNGFIYRIPSDGITYYVVGDIHGDRESLLEIIKRTGIFLSSENAQEYQKRIIFLGDYIDRGNHGMEVLIGVLALKIAFPNKIFLLKGNHELLRSQKGKVKPSIDGVNLFIEFWSVYLKPVVLLKLKQLFDSLPAIALIDDQILLVHGGIPRPVEEGADYSYIASINDLDDSEIIHEMLWSDPEDKDDVIIGGNTRFSFARKHFEAFCKMTGIRILIRAHEPCNNGYNTLYGGHLYTVFSSGRPSNDTFYYYVHPKILRILGAQIEAINLFEVIDQPFEGEVKICRSGNNKSNEG